jgi:Mg2+-importing ATPase
VDIAKESASVVLLEKDLLVLEEGILEGRRTYANMIKYIKMTASSNFGNMLSVLAASAFLPFLPMASVQLILLNMIYDFSCTLIPWDNVDAEYLKKPRQWSANSITRFMLRIGPTSSVFDLATYALMFFVICPAVCGGAYGTLSPAAQALFVSVFRTGWFVESMWTQALVVHMIRTEKVPFVQSRASRPLLYSTFCAIAVVTAIPFTPFGTALGLHALPAVYFACLLALVLGYMALATAAKKSYIRRYGELL